MNLFLILLGKVTFFLIRFLNIGSGSTWPGHIALSINKKFIKEIIKKNPKLKIVLIAGTNGKTTTAKLIRTILEKSGKKVFQNEGGANLLNGIASSILLHSSVLCALNYDFAIFEIDENTLPLILKEIPNPDFILLLNLFRDQLDRYGEVNTIADNWKKAIKQLSNKTILILNADDPQIVYLNFYHISKAIPIPYRKRSYDKVSYFGVEAKKPTALAHQHASDSTYCPNCRKKLSYSPIYFSHLGEWECEGCGLKHPEKTFSDSPFYPLEGLYNQYNTNAAVLLAKLNNINNEIIEQSLKEFKPAFGRQETIIVNNKKIRIFLSKNPTSFNESLRTIASLNAQNLLIILNDRIPDGKDVSWIWDVDMEEFIGSSTNIVVSGDRAFDMGLRIKYAMKTQNSKLKTQNHNSKFKIIKKLENAIKDSLKLISEKETLYILPTYSAMLEVRKILTGKKIL